MQWQDRKERIAPDGIDGAWDNALFLLFLRNRFQRWKIG